ncbi:Putative O-methyltransferase [Mycoavidus cysteinexigens]|uniref:O-methyltransferase n=1 Tax=Mycoavidus cysteinexigens TaxID=1553431 RepID=A0A2Z6EWB9_9BURK|nr:hypothetical protein [Mycoavidus cysteinexigens]BBE09753.1 Putative O-methyltransferase [Mycoavidus cysteinexigens]GAM53910.1 hypothetical protein EBME_2373 [bacterium endosymbiont of Mortierella elongata FMR23-6]GLR02386.1 hypothetical protein GCM10007934_22040 [Mycoavidus cysteinexigens]
MRHISKNPSPTYPQQSVSSAGETPSRSGNLRRARSPSPLGSSTLAKRRRGEAEEAQKSNSGGFDRARFDEGDAGIDNLVTHKITTDMNFLTIDDSNSCFAEAFEATYPSYEGDWRLSSDFFPLGILCDLESQERLEEREENQSDSAEDALTDLPIAHADDSLADEGCEMSSEGEPEANHARPSSGVWESLPGQTRMRINHKALQSFIKTESPDLSMRICKLREKYIEKYGEESCPNSRVFASGLQKLKAKQVGKHPNQPKLRRKYINADRGALQNFIKAVSPDLSMSAEKLRDAYIKTYGKELCPGLAGFSRVLGTLRDEWTRENPNQPKLWQQHINVDHDAIQNFIKTTSPDLTMSLKQLHDKYKKTYGEESCPSQGVFYTDLQKLRDKWVKENPGKLKPWEVHTKVRNLSKQCHQI